MSRGRKPLGPRKCTSAVVLGTIGAMEGELVAQGSDDQEQLKAITARLDRNEANIASLQDGQRRITSLEEQVEVDRQLLVALQAEGVLERQHSEHLETALQTSRVIGAAIGIIMVSEHLTDREAFERLRRASQDRNRKLRSLASQVVATGDLSALREE